MVYNWLFCKILSLRYRIAYISFSTLSAVHNNKVIMQDDIAICYELHTPFGAFSILSYHQVINVFLTKTTRYN